MPFKKLMKIINLNTNLISQELIQMAKFISVSDFSVQRSIPLLLDTGSSADFNGGVATVLDTGRIGVRATGFWPKETEINERKRGKSLQLEQVLTTGLLHTIFFNMSCMHVCIYLINTINY